MPELSDIYRDYHKNDPQRLALLQQKVQAIRGLLSPAALAIFERELSAWQLIARRKKGRSICPGPRP
jgi:hypothetical protein